jgi:hypothetical protein
MPNPPSVDIDLPSFSADPYPTLALLRGAAHPATPSSGVRGTARVDTGVRLVRALDRADRQSPRRIAQEATIGGATLKPESRAFLVFGSANRDEAHFEAADEFRPGRDTSKAMAFGAGCAGTWAARSMVANVALPLAFERLPGLQLNPREPIEITGWAFRGLRNLP